MPLEMQRNLPQHMALLPSQYRQRVRAKEGPRAQDARVSIPFIIQHRRDREADPRRPQPLNRHPRCGIEIDADEATQVEVQHRHARALLLRADAGDGMDHEGHDVPAARIGPARPYPRPVDCAGGEIAVSWVWCRLM